MQATPTRKGRPKSWPKDFGRQVKLYRTQRGNGRVVFQLADPSQGRRQLRQFTDEAKAVEEARRIVNLLSTGQAYAAGMRSDERAAFGRAMTFLSPTGVSLEVACSVFADAFAAVGDAMAIVEAARAWAENRRNVVARRVDEAVQEYLRTKEDQGASHRYLKDLRFRLARLSTTIPGNTDKVSTPALQAWLDGMKASPQSMRNFKTVATGFFAFCKSRGWSAGNPAEGLLLPRVKGNAEPEVFSPTEFARLLAAADPTFLPCVVLAGFCGIRSAEIERLHWEDINLATAEITIRRGTAKTKSRRIVPLPDAAKAWLAPYAGRIGPVWPGTHDGFYKAQEAAAEATRTQALPSVPWKANGLRHAYASHRLAQTGDAVRVAHEMGNSPEVVHGHYKALVTTADATAWFTIYPQSPTNVTMLPSTQTPAATRTAAHS